MIAAIKNNDVLIVYFILSLFFFSEEWQWFKSLSNGSLPNDPSEIQMKFQKALSTATRQLLTDLDIPENMIDLHR